MEISMTSASFLQMENTKCIIAAQPMVRPFTAPVMLAKISSAVAEESNINTSVDLPRSFSLEQNYPNPFNPQTEIRFQIPEASHVVVRIFNVIGEEIRTLVNSPYEAGYHGVRWYDNR